MVLLEQSRRMDRALRAAGKPVEFVTLDGEDHWLSGEATDGRLLTRRDGRLGWLRLGKRGVPMSGFVRSLRAAVLAVAGVLSMAVATHAAPLSAYGRLPMIEDAQVSPDGTMIAFSVTDGEKRFVLVRRLGEEKPVARVEAGDSKVRDVSWGTSRYLMVTTSKTSEVAGLDNGRGEYMRTAVYDLVGAQAYKMMDGVPDSMNVVLSIPVIRTIDGELCAIVEGIYFPDSYGRVALFRVRLRDGDTKMIDRGIQDSVDWVVGPDGVGAAMTTYDLKTSRWQLRIRNGKDWQVVEDAILPLERPALAGFGRDGRSILLSTNDDDGHVLLKEYAPGQTKATDVDVGAWDGLIRDPATRQLIGTRKLDGDDQRYTFFDPKDAAVWKGVQGAFPGNRVTLVSWSDDRRKIVVHADGATDGAAYGLVDLDSKSAEWLGMVYGAIKPADIGEVRPVSYKAADGLTITGYLTLPRGKDPRNLPLVVLPHGGPASRDQPGFDWWSQALASRGYAVLRPNFRGSEGFGTEFLEAGYGEFGRKMQTDLSDGVRDLAGKGIIDPKRVCIVGASYGGYAALAGVTLDPGVYRCAASIAGISDLRRMLDSQRTGGRSRNTPSHRYWSRFMGVEAGEEAKLAAISPIAHADKVAAPVLLIHGKDDTVVEFAQSKIMYDALKKAGKPVEMVTLEREDHWLSRGDTRLQMLTAVVDFLEKHNPPN